MKKLLGIALLSTLIAMFSVAALADDIEGRIEAIDHNSQTFVVQGITFNVTPTTDYDDGLRSFADLSIGQKVEVDFVYRDGKHYATEIELDD